MKVPSKEGFRGSASHLKPSVPVQKFTRPKSDEEVIDGETYVRTCSPGICIREAEEQQCKCLEGPFEKYPLEEMK